MFLAVKRSCFKGLLKTPADELSFSKAIDIACQVEDAAQVEKETICGTTDEAVHKTVTENEPNLGSRTEQKKSFTNTSDNFRNPMNRSYRNTTFSPPVKHQRTPGEYTRCGDQGHWTKDYKFLNSV